MDTWGACAPSLRASPTRAPILLESPGRLYTRAQLLDAMDETGASEAFDRSIDLHVSRIRQKLEDDPKHPRYLVTVWGEGYRFQC